MNETTDHNDPALRVLMERVSARVEYLVASHSELRRELENHYVRIETFRPVERLVYGVVGLILVAVVSLWLGVLDRAPGPSSQSAPASMPTTPGGKP